MIVAALDQLHHQLVIGNAEAPKPAQTGAGVHEEVQQRPARGLEHFFHGELGGIALIHRFHQIDIDVGKGFLAAIIVIDHTCRRRRIRVDDVVVKLLP